MRASEHGIAAAALPREIDFLKVARSFIETQHEEEVMHKVTEVKNVQHLLIIALRLIGIESQNAIAERSLKRVKRSSQYGDGVISDRGLALDPGNWKTVRQVRRRRVDRVISEWT